MLGNVKIEIRKGGDFDPLPMDKYTCQIIDVNLISQFNQFKGAEEDVLNYQFQVLDDKSMPEKDGEEVATTRGRFLWKRCRPALNNRSWLLKLAKAAYGRDLTKEEIDNFNPEEVVGKQVNVMVEQSESKDGQKIFNNIVAFNKVLKNLEPVAKEGPKTPGVVVKATQPAAPGAEEAEAFINGLKNESGEAEDEDIKAMEAKLALAKAKAKAAAKKKA
jgi:hypothetical protein